MWSWLFLQPPNPAQRHKQNTATVSGNRSELAYNMFFICSSRSSHVCTPRYRTCGNFGPRKQIYHCNQNKHLCHSSWKNSSGWLYLPPCTKTLGNNECSAITLFYDVSVDDISPALHSLIAERHLCYNVWGNHSEMIQSTFSVVIPICFAQFS